MKKLLAISFILILSSCKKDRPYTEVLKGSKEWKTIKMYGLWVNDSEELFKYDDSIYINNGFGWRSSEVTD